MKSIISASASLLLAGLGLAPLTAAHATNQISSLSAISQPTTQRYDALYDRQQQAKQPPGQTFDPPAKSTGMGLDFDPYPPGYGVYSGGSG